MKLSALIAGFTCLLIAQSVLAAEKVYKWTDDKGQVHYSQHPPLNVHAELIKPDIGYVESSTTSTEVTTDKPATAKKNADPKTGGDTAKPEDGLKDKVRCENARKNLDTLKTYTHIRMKGDDGEFRYLTPDEQQEKLAEASKAVEESCE